ncbi:MAG: dihydrofolate reductase family protein [Sphingomonas sp.]|uniref:dihydrofolate reductase family protein n=1 Tax=Sphingomonas sp. TaxID=28214 RepID=UPI0017E15475|nr:dihydrofolate reductase family protein [Sphingomonas sp.]MBA3667914.1 dihydrofolate reductase family protein [Sphingomonas sp.]
MRKLIAGFKISLDGKTEGPEGMADWAESWSEDFGLTPQIDACLLGGGMYPGYEGYWTGIRNDPHKPAWITGLPPTQGEIEWAEFSAKTPHYVLSRSLTSAQWPNTRFIRDIDEVGDLKRQPGKDIYLMGGARVTNSLWDVGLVDEIRLLVHPLVAGEGASLFAPNVSRRGLDLREARQLPTGVVSLVYDVATGSVARA